MAKNYSSLEDNIFGDSVIKEKEKPKRGRQEDGTWITSSGEVLPAKNRTRRVGYPEPEEFQVDGHEEIVESEDGKLSFFCKRMDDPRFKKANYPNRKRLDLRYEVLEVYAGQPRPYYSYDELVQIRKGEIKR